ncbi:MAG TPA: carboxypeptidase-like regulatory domain-containing protein [Planctomycetota bacterium]|nr:carboxypeptidase-like regulatory domain-containing protein [Planctomycetota bacterium]
MRDADTGGAIPRFGIFERGTGGAEGFPLGSSREHRLHWFASRDGSFARADLSPGSYDLLFVAEGYVSRVLERVGTDRASLEVLLTREATIRGVVVERGTGAPVAGATVLPVDPESRHSPRIDVDSFDAWTTTSVEGLFELRGLGPERVGLKVHHPDFVDAQADPFDLRPRLAVEGVLVSMSRGGAIEGSVAREDGSPLAGLQVQALSAWECWDRRESWSDGEGCFLIRGLRAGPYRVVAYTTGISEVVPAVDVMIEEGRTVRVGLVSPSLGTCTVRGRVLRGREPIEDAAVQLHLCQRSGPWSWHPSPCPENKTDADGGFHFENVPPGSASLYVEVGFADPQFGRYGTTSSFPLVVPATTEYRFDAELPRGEITGRVERELDGSPVQGAEIRVLGRHGDGWLWEGSAWTREDGSYRIRGIDPGTHLMVVHRAGDSDEGTSTLGRGSRRSVAVTEGEATRVDFALRPLGSIVVHVLGPDGLPVPRAEVRLVTSDHPPPCIVGPRAPETAEPGVYRSDQISEGRYSVMACAEGFAAAASEGSTIRAGQETVCRVDLLRGTPVRVKLLEPDGSTNFSPYVEFTDGMGRQFWEAPSARGTIVSLTLTPGAYRMTVRGRYLERKLPVVVGTSPQEIIVPLREGGTPY